MKPESPAQAVQSALTKLASLGTEIQNTQARLEADTADRAARLKSTDLNDPKALDEISRLHVKVELLSLRIPALEEMQTAAEAELLRVSNHCISRELSPRVGAALRATEAKVRSQLKCHFAEEHALDRAVADSQLVRAINAVGCSTTETPLGGAVRHAENVLKEIAKLESIEASLK